MAKIAADPQELRDLAQELRQSAGRLSALGREAVDAARASGYPGAAGAEVEALAFDVGVRGHGIETDVLAFRTARAADLFAAADGPFFGIPGLVGLVHAWKGKLGDLAKFARNLPYPTKAGAWRSFRKELARGRSARARYWGFGDARKMISSWGRSRWETLRHPRSSFTKFVGEGRRAVTAVERKGGLLSRLKPLRRFGGKVVGKLFKPLDIISTYRSSKGRSVIARLTSTVVQTFVTKFPPFAVANIVTGGQVGRAFDGVVTGVEAMGDERQLAQWSDDARSGRSGWALKEMQRVGDRLGGGLYDGWETLHGH